MLFIVNMSGTSLYGTKQIVLPTPHCIVFYNGDKEIPEEQILKLSDAFENKDKEADAELKVKVLNINYGHNMQLMEKCKALEEYAEFVTVSKQFVANYDDKEKALNDAIEYCIKNHILELFLKRYRQEVLGMLLEEFDVEKYERSLKEEGREEGREEGICALVNTCHRLGVSEEDTVNALIREFSLTREKAEEYNKNAKYLSRRGK